jgi:hypothetical protein
VRTVKVEERTVGRTRFQRLEFNAAEVPAQAALIQRLIALADPDLVLDVRLTGVRPDELDFDADEVEAAVAGSFLKVRFRDASVPALTTGALPPPDTIAGAFIRGVEARVAELEANGDADRAREMRDVLRLGRLLLSGQEVTL